MQSGSDCPVQFTDEPTRLARHAPRRTALQEIGAWLPFLAKFESGVRHFPQWSFWPATVFSRRAVHGVLTLVDTDPGLRSLMEHCRICAAEEVILPTLVSLLGLDMVPTPFDDTVVRFRAEFSLDVLAESLDRENRFWMHPVPRRWDDPLRAGIRERFRQYHTPTGPSQPPTLNNR